MPATPETTSRQYAQPVVNAAEAPLIRAPEKIQSVYTVTTIAACLPMAAGWLYFGYHAILVSLLSVASCVAIEWGYFRVTHSPALLGRAHAYLTGVLLALTLPPFTPWYVVILAAAFAILVGKAVFGGVGHFLWQPALVGRFAVAVILPVLAQLTPAGSDQKQVTLTPTHWPVLSRDHLLLGDLDNVAQDRLVAYRGWRSRQASPGTEGFAMQHPAETLAPLSRGEEPAYSALAHPRQDLPNSKPAALTLLPPIGDLLFGARPGGIGETCAAMILVAGIYLVYRNYVKWQLPLAFLASAAVVAAVAPVQLAGPNQTVEWMWFPVFAEGLDVGFTYVCYQVLSGALLLSAFFLATEMTSSPVTTGGQVIFGVAGGWIAMGLQLYFETAIPAYLAVLAMNTLTPTIDAIWLPRVFGQKHFEWLRIPFRGKPTKE
ncbi:MAG: RnfABCDGE type electron transport complex subunit D [Phycisphaerae bacterium]|nr:RnfABCDGE type electron transport complex subunit D [Phycisphaerae bacterium]